MLHTHSLLTKARLKRLSQPDLLDPGHTDCFRLCDAEGDFLPGLVIDCFSGHWLVQTRDRAFPNELLATQAEFGWKSLWWKKLSQEQKSAPQAMTGNAEPKITVRELGAAYQIDFTAGYSQGIFLDQRPQRACLAQKMAPGSKLLNLFAYTCGFSVVAARAGAQTESIDLSRPFLDWGKENFRLNGLGLENHFFCRGDSFEWLRRLAKKQRLYDVIVLDPPTFSRSDTGRIWQAEKQYAQLVAAALPLLAPGGELLCSTNHFGLSPEQFYALLREGFHLAQRPLQRIIPGKMPDDFTGYPYLKVAWAS